MRCVRVVVVCPKQCFRPCVTTWMPHPPSRPRHNARSTVLLVTGILEICHIVTISCVQYGLSTVYPSGGAILTSLAVWYPRLSRTIGIWTGCSTDSISDSSPSITLTDAAPTRPLAEYRPHVVTRVASPQATIPREWGRGSGDDRLQVSGARAVSTCVIQTVVTRVEGPSSGRPLTCSEQQQHSRRKHRERQPGQWGSRRRGARGGPSGAMRAADASVASGSQANEGVIRERSERRPSHRSNRCERSEWPPSQRKHRARAQRAAAKPLRQQTQA